MRPLDQKGLNIWVWNCIKELCKESGDVLDLTSNHLKVGPPQTLRASPSWHFPKNASTFTRIDILRRSTSAKPYFVHFRQKFIFFWNGPKWPRRAQEGSKWSKTLRLAILVPFGPFWITMEHRQACHVMPFLAQSGPFLGHPQSWTVDSKVKKKVHHQVSYVWPACRTPKHPVWDINMAAIYEHVKNRSKFREKWPFFCHYLVMNGKLWVPKKFSTHI